MATRKKPIGEEWKKWEERWSRSTHEEKLVLCQEYGVTYDSGKHWFSERDTTPIEGDSELDVTVREGIKEVLAMPVRSNLDFVTFDLETTNLTADFSVLLCGCIKPFGGEVMVWRADEYESWGRNRADDSEIVRLVAEELGKHAVIITHYGSRFDIPYLRAKMIRYGMPPLPPMFGVDTWSIARANFKVSSRRLENLVRYLEVGKKEKVDGGIWMKAAYGGKETSVEAMDYIVKHCEVDVEVLERLATLSFPYLKSIKRL